MWVVKDKKNLEVHSENSDKVVKVHTSKGTSSRILAHVYYNLNVWDYLMGATSFSRRIKKKIFCVHL